MIKSDLQQLKADKAVELEGIAKPLMQWLAENAHPHASIRVHANRAELHNLAEENGLVINYGAQRILAAGRELPLGHIAFRMLVFFITHPDRIYSRQQLIDRIWGDQVYVEERTVDVHVRSIRRALEPSGHADMIESVRGVGYCFRRRSLRHGE